MKESEVQHQILTLLSVAGVVVWRQNSGATKIGSRFIRFTSRAGISDIIGITRTGRFLAIECKSPTGRSTDAQKKFLAEITANGGVAFIARSIDDVLARAEEITGLKDGFDVVGGSGMPYL